MVSGVGSVALWNNKRKARGVENEPCYYTGHDLDDFKHGKPLLSYMHVTEIGNNFILILT